MRVVHRRTDFSDQAQRFANVASPGRQGLVERPPFDVFHHVVVLSLVYAGIDDRNDSRML